MVDVNLAGSSSFVMGTQPVLGGGGGGGSNGILCFADVVPRDLLFVRKREDPAGNKVDDFSRANENQLVYERGRLVPTRRTNTWPGYQAFLGHGRKI